MAKLFSNSYLAALLAALLAAIPIVEAAPVLMISVDGMRADAVLEADAHGLKIPYLRSLLRDGAYARGVIGVFPTVTYPSHTTLITGVAPREHGIYDNLEFDPLHQHADTWYWYADQIRAPTLWHAAHAAALTTASIGWPVSVGANDVDFLIPEYWRISRPTPELNPSDRYLIAALARPEGLLHDMEKSVGPYLMGNDTSIGADEIKTRYALEILRAHKPKFMTIHLSSLDHAEHEHGVFSDEANQILESIDAQLARLFAAASANDPHAIAVVVSDHGFAPITHRINLYQPFIRANLLQASSDARGRLKVTGWRAQPWPAGGMAAIMLNPADPGGEEEVRHLLQTLQADVANGIADVLERDAARARGGFPDAAFLVLMKPGYYLSDDVLDGLQTDLTGTHGTHGYSPDLPEMRASFFIAGNGIARHRDLGLIDMRQIAPTVAGVLKVALPSAQGAALPIRPADSAVAPPIRP
jgi:predicted AlkP superfamily pyrophosphatase or phosphodiesterase